VTSFVLPSEPAVPRFTHGIRKVTEREHGLVCVVGAAAQLNVLARRGAAERKGLAVVELDEPAFDAASMRTDERTSTLVALPHGTPDGGGNVAGSRLGFGRLTRAGRNGATAPLEVVEQSSQRAIEHCGQITTGNVCLSRSCTRVSLARESDDIVN